MKHFLTGQWENLIMANYIVDPAILEPYLPKGVELDYYDGNTYVSLVGFMFKNTKIFRIPIPKLGTFEEVNLRFYVVRKENNILKRGVVFINETVPNKFVALLANLLYKEHYTAVPTKHFYSYADKNKNVEYKWKVNNEWNKISVVVEAESQIMPLNSFEEFIFEHYYGYTKIDNSKTEEYYIEHPRWKINNVADYSIICDFKKMYGPNFQFLNNILPTNVIFAEGSSIAVNWKRMRF